MDGGVDCAKGVVGRFYRILLRKSKSKQREGSADGICTGKGVGTGNRKKGAGSRLSSQLRDSVGWPRLWYRNIRLPLLLYRNDTIGFFFLMNNNIYFISCHKFNC